MSIAMLRNSTRRRDETSIGTSVSPQPGGSTGERRRPMALQGRFSADQDLRKCEAHPTSALVEIDRISQALANQAPFPCREDATKKKLKKKWILRYFVRFPVTSEHPKK